MKWSTLGGIIMQLSLFQVILKCGTKWNYVLENDEIQLHQPIPQTNGKENYDIYMNLIVLLELFVQLDIVQKMAHLVSIVVVGMLLICRFQKV